MLKPYMAFSREGGSLEGAVLVFAHNIKEAKPLAWREAKWEITEDYTDLGIRLIKNGAFLFKEADEAKLAADVAHVISDPTPCKDCELWGYPLNDAGYCEDCADDRKAIAAASGK